jgi:hypothetical protein
MMTPHRSFRVLTFTPRRRRAPKKDSKQIAIMRVIERECPEYFNVLAMLANKKLAEIEAEANYDEGA